MMKQLCCALLVGILVAGSHAFGQVKKVFPKPLHKLSFNLSLADFSEQRREIEPNRLRRESFRYAWREDFGGKKGIGSVWYYFDDGDRRPFYEVIIEYTDLRQRDKWLDRNYGAPQAENGTEWSFPSGEGYEIRAWCYQHKLVIVAVLPGTEWDDR